jgi:transcriptional regulator with XRE-family HTH domain
MRDNEPETLGGYLRHVREAAGMSIRQLAQQAGINHVYLGRIENGERSKPAPDVLQRLADALGMDAAKLLERSGIKLGATLPTLKTYFRRKLGVNGDEAEILAGLIEEYQANRVERRKREGTI